MLQYMPGYYLAWYVEGFAEFVMTAKFQGATVEVDHYDQNRADWLLESRWIAIENLLTKSPAELDRDDTARFYALSWLLTHYLNNKGERASQFADYIEALRRGEGAIPALKQHFGRTPDELQRDLKAYIGKRLNLFVYQASAPVPDQAISVVRMSEAADDSLMLHARLRMSSEGSSDGGDILAAVRAAAQKHPDDRDGRMMLARAEANFGDPATAQTLLASMIAANPEDRDANYLLGYSLLMDISRRDLDDPEIAKRARRAFARANQLQPDHYATLFGYTEAANQGPKGMTPDDINVLVRAADLAPQVDEIGMNAGLALHETGRTREAIELLRPIAANPHGGEGAAWAKTYLEKIAKEAAAAPAKLIRLP
jgi:cytochrome c-type biogenesis protein CcmH/NrfG